MAERLPFARSEAGSEKRFESVAAALRRSIFRAVDETLGDGILLSGGLDTTIVTAVAAALLGGAAKDDLSAFTVILNGAPSPDLGFAELVAGRFHIPQRVERLEFSELEASLPAVVAVLKSFDPMEIRNSVVAYLGMSAARKEGRSAIMTGDGSDELFAGYSFVFNQPEEKAKEALAHLWKVMRFSSIPLAKSLGMEARLPFLQPEVKELAMNGVDFSFLVGRREGSDEVFGKYILRRAFEDMLPAEVTWRTKTPIEHGSGTTVLPAWYSGKVADGEFAEKRRAYYEEDHVRLRDKEQLRYYEVYRKVLGPPVAGKGEKTCPACTSDVPASATFCTVCGEYPI